VRRGHRSGYILPFVVIATALAAVLALALVTSAWRAQRAVRFAASGSDAHAHAESALAAHLSAWRAESLWQLPLQHAAHRFVEGAPGRFVTVTTHRTHPLVLWVDAAAEGDQVAPERRGQAVVQRVVWLEPPPVPVEAVLQATGVVTGGAQALVSGLDIPEPGSPCGTTRDTASVAAVIAAELQADGAGTWPLEPPWQRVTGGQRGTLLATAGLLEPFARIVARSGGAWPWPPSSDWHAMSLHAAAAPPPGERARHHVKGPTAFTGLMLVHGDLILHGDVQFDGVLVVVGDLDARDASLRLRGALIVADPSGGTAQLGGTTRLLFDRCAIQMALAAAGTPRSVPFLLWNTPAR
jgi:hypothetical protein